MVISLAIGGSALGPYHQLSAEENVCVRSSPGVNTIVFAPDVALLPQVPVLIVAEPLGIVVV